MRGGAAASNMLDAFVAQRTHIDAAQQMFSSTQEDGRDGQVQLVNKGSPQILPNCGYAAAQPDVATARRIPRLL